MGEQYRRQPGRQRILERIQGDDFVVDQLLLSGGQVVFVEGLAGIEQLQRAVEDGPGSRPQHDVPVGRRDRAVERELREHLNRGQRNGHHQDHIAVDLIDVDGFGQRDGRSLGIGRQRVDRGREAADTQFLALRGSETAEQGRIDVAAVDA